MKRLFLGLFLLISSYSQAQDAMFPVDTTSGRIHYSEVVSTNMNKDVLYANAKLWFAQTYTSANNVIQMDDKSSGMLVGKAGSNVLVDFGYGKANYTLWYTIKISLKDGKYKYDITDLSLQPPVSVHNTNPAEVAAETILFVDTTNYKKAQLKVNDSFRDGSSNAITSIIGSLKTTMSKTEDW